MLYFMVYKMSPTDTIEHLKTLLDTKVKLKEHASPTGISLELNEPDKSARLKKLVISGFTNVIAINHDKITPISKFLFKSHDSTKTCDGIIFCIIDEEPYILAVDLKSSLSNKGEHRYKTQAGKNLISYLNCVLEQFEDCSLSDWKIYYCIFHLSDPKRPTEIIKNVSNDPKEPAYLQVENDQTISIRKILGLRL